MADKLNLNGETLAMLREAFHLAELSPEIKADEVLRLFPNSGLFAYVPDEHIIEQDEAGKDLYVLCSGQVVITKIFGGAGITLATLEPGAVFGEMALLRDGIRVATAVARAQCQVFRIVARDVETVLKSHPRLGTMLQELAAKRSQ
ncbi:MAG: cyclic nucleotide-binding domain-containing protein [Elusimicrobia bacterium]|nr:cyclic nucleotide-binding domain-containing protein [Elusimicrobiota bacterium]